MFRKTTLALTAVLALGAAALVPTAASAKHFGHGFGFHGFRGGLGITILDTSASCYQYQYFRTPRGYLRPVLVNVCQ